jgi:amino acid permease
LEVATSYIHLDGDLFQGFEGNHGRQDPQPIYEVVSSITILALCLWVCQMVNDKHQIKVHVVLVLYICIVIPTRQHEALDVYFLIACHVY